MTILLSSTAKPTKRSFATYSVAASYAVAGSRAGYIPVMAGHPSISIVARDRSGGYGEARTLPKAAQVVDRWHEMEDSG